MNINNLQRSENKHCKKSKYTSFIVIIISSIPLSLFIHQYSQSYFHNIPSSDFFNLHSLFLFEIAALSLTGIWFLYSFIISKYFKMEFGTALKIDSYTYLPVLLLPFTMIHLKFYTQGLFSTSATLITILFLIILLKTASILDIKEFPTRYSRSLKLFSVILPLVLINYFLFSYQDKNYYSPNFADPIPLMEKLKKEYPADKLSLFEAPEPPGIYKKKIKINLETRNALVLIPPKSVKKSVLVPPNSTLKFGLGVWEESYQGKGDGILFNVYIKSKQDSKKVYSLYIDPKHYKENQKWYDVEIDLSDYKNNEITILFETYGSPETLPPFERKPNNIDDFAVISDPRIMTKTLPVKPKHPNIILISIDTLRADHLGCYGYKRKDISPNIDYLASQGILFESAISHAPWTLPAHMSIFTSLLPSYHQVMNPCLENAADCQRLSYHIPTLTEVLKSAGYKTTAFASHTYISGLFGFSKGFDVYKESPYNRYSFTDDSSFKELTDWLSTNRFGKEFFLFIHTYKVHTPYLSLRYANEVMTKQEREELKQYIDKGMAWENHKFDNLLKKLHLYKKEVTETLYDGGIKETDEYVGRLTKKLRELDLFKNTIIILTSDHGEEFGDHDEENFYDSHNWSLYDELIHIPLIMILPGNFPRGTRIKSQVRHIDIMPTILKLANIKYPANKMQGTSLLPMIKGDEYNEEMVAISEALANGPYEGKSIRTNTYKYLYLVNFKESEEKSRLLISKNPPIEQLFSLKNDPGEKINLCMEENNLCTKLKNKINKILNKAVSGPKNKKNNQVMVNDKMKKQLKTLGYIQ